MSLFRVPLRQFHRFSTRSTSFRSLFPKTNRASLWTRIAFRRDGSPRSRKKGAAYSALFSAATLLGYGGVLYHKNLNIEMERAARALNLILLDSVAYPSVLGNHDSESLGPEVENWSREAYKQVLAYFASLLLCSTVKHVDIEDSNEERTKYQQAAENIVEFVWKFECGEHPAEAKRLIRWIVGDACVASHIITNRCRYQISVWDSRQTQISLDSMANNTLQHLIPSITQENIRPLPVHILLPKNPIKWRGKIFSLGIRKTMKIWQNNCYILILCHPPPSIPSNRSSSRIYAYHTLLLSYLDSRVALFSALVQKMKAFSNLGYQTFCLPQTSRMTPCGRASETSDDWAEVYNGGLSMAFSGNL